MHNPGTLRTNTLWKHGQSGNVKVSVSNHPIFSPGYVLEMLPHLKCCSLKVFGLLIMSRKSYDVGISSIEVDSSPVIPAWRCPHENKSAQILGSLSLWLFCQAIVSQRFCQGVKLTLTTLDLLIKSRSYSNLESETKVNPFLDKEEKTVGSKSVAILAAVKHA